MTSSSVLRKVDTEPSHSLAPDASQTEYRSQISALSSRLAHVAGTEFLTEYALAASEMLSADYFVISRLNPNSNLIRSVVFVADGKIAKNITYSLDGTPCARAVDGGIVVYADNVANLFPRDAFLTNYGVKGYAGAALRSTSDETLGVVVALTKSPIANEALARAIVEHFSAQIAVTLETIELLERYSWVIDEAADGVWEWDIATGGTVVSDNLMDLLGRDERRPFDLAKIESAIHPDDKVKHTTALQGHLSQQSPYNLRLRLRDKSGEFRWYHSRGKAVRNDTGRPVKMIGCFSDIHDLIETACTK